MVFFCYDWVFLGGLWWLLFDSGVVDIYIYLL